MRLANFLPFFMSISFLSWLPASAEEAFRYNEQTGRCVDRDGKTGLNSITVNELLASKNGECGNFGGEFFSPGLGFAPHTPLEGFNFKGADFSTILFSGGPWCGVNFVNADLQGVNLNVSQGVYWCIEGTIDLFTSYQIDENNRPQLGVWIVSPMRLRLVH